MNNIGNDLIIIGCPRAGKTTLTNMLMKNDSAYHNISLDSLTMAIKSTMPESGIKEDSKLKIISERIVPFLASYLHCYKCDYPDKKYLIEGLQINPDHLMSEPFFSKANVICLGFPNATIDEIFNNIRREDEQLSFSYTKKMSDDELRERVSFYIRYSKFLQNKCDEYNIPFYETNKNRENVLISIFNELIKKEKISDEMSL